MYARITRPDSFEDADHFYPLKYEYDKTGDEVENSHYDHDDNDKNDCLILQVQPVENIWIKLFARLNVPILWKSIKYVRSHCIHFRIIRQENFITSNLIWPPIVQA